MVQQGEIGSYEPLSHSWLTFSRLSLCKPSADKYKRYEFMITCVMTWSSSFPVCLSLFFFLPCLYCVSWDLRGDTYVSCRLSVQLSFILSTVWASRSFYFDSCSLQKEASPIKAEKGTCVLIQTKKLYTHFTLTFELRFRGFFLIITSMYIWGGYVHINAGA